MAIETERHAAVKGKHCAAADGTNEFGTLSYGAKLELPLRTLLLRKSKSKRRSLT